MRLPATLLTILLVFTQGCAGTSSRLPAVTEEPSGERHAGKIIWHDLVTHTPEASKRFYRELFGWTFEDQGVDFGFGRTVNYTLIRNRGQLIGGMVDATRLGKPDPGSLSQWVVAMSVDDIDVAVNAVKANGGRVLTPPTDVAERGTIALVEDDQGAFLSLLQTRDGDPADSAAQVGGFLWDEIWSPDVERAAAFYGGLAKVVTETFRLPDGSSYRFMSGAGMPRFGLLETPIEGLSPTWASYVRVEQPEQIVSRVPELGGQILAPLQDRGENEKAALFVGPSGAGLAIQTWSRPDEMALGTQ